MQHAINLDEFYIKEEKVILEQGLVDAESADKTNITVAVQQIGTEENEKMPIIKGINVAFQREFEGVSSDAKGNEMMLDEIHRQIKLEDVYFFEDDELDQMKSKLKYACNFSQNLEARSSNHDRQQKKIGNQKEKTNSPAKNKFSKHGKNKVHHCNQCAYSAKFRSKLNEHMTAVHDKIGNYKCAQCQFSSTYESQLKRHKKAIHDKKKDYKCDLCEYSSSRKDSLKLHIQGVHDKIKMYKCEQCGYSAHRKSDLIKHVEAVHYKIKKHKCDQCEYSASQKSNLNKHKDRKHQGWKKA